MTPTMRLTAQARRPAASFRPRDARRRRCRCLGTDASSQQQQEQQQQQRALQRNELSQTLTDLEAVLPGMSCSQLAATVTSVQQTYRAALLSAQAGHCHASVNDVIEFYEGVLPDRSWLLTFRAAVAQHLPSASPPDAEPGTPLAPAGAAAAAPGDKRCSCCSPRQLSEILAGVAGLPVQVVQPLPIGFGTPRWSRPLAAADPAAWEAWLGDVAAAYAAAVDAQLLDHHHLDDDEEQQQKQTADGSLIEELGHVIVSLACCMRWANVNVDDDRITTQAFRQQVLDCLAQGGQPGAADDGRGARGSPPLPRADTSSSSSSTDTTAAGSTGEATTGEAAGSQGQQDQAQQQQQQPPPPGGSRPGQLALAGSVGHRLTACMLLLLLPPPRPALAAFFAATEAQLPQLFDVATLQALVRGLLFLGASPSEEWLRALVGVVKGRAALLEPRDVQVFVEGFRFFGTKAGKKAGWLHDATAQLEEFTLC